MLGLLPRVLRLCGSVGLRLGQHGCLWGRDGGWGLRLLGVCSGLGHVIQNRQFFSVLIVQKVFYIIKFFLIQYEQIVIILLISTLCVNESLQDLRRFF